MLYVIPCGNMLVFQKLGALEPALWIWNVADPLETYPSQAICYFDEFSHCGQMVWGFVGFQK